MRVIPTLVAATILAAASACTQQPQQGSATANADAMADQLEAKANNYSMMADNAVDSESAIALENASGALDDQSANVRAEANPKQGVKGPK